MSILPREFYNRSPLLVAKDLLGKVLVHNFDGKILSGRIVEVEAYMGNVDEAAHSFVGKTKRNTSLFGAPGTAYVHSIHMQNCIDIVTEEVGIPTSVLIRALEPIEGIELMQQFRNKMVLKDLTSGPGKLCQALQITRQYDGVDVTKQDSSIYIYDDNYQVEEVVSDRRIGISKATEHEYRFYVKGSLFVSKR